jgi:hypothetical protein
MQNLFALLVGINNYNQPEIRDLDGCLNDLEQVNLFLEVHSKRNENVKLHRKILKNAKATRQAVIDGFKLFEDAQDGDVCLFYFSGHGSQIDAPKEFWNESDDKLEAIVCHVEKGNDNLLIDKELSFLIANVQKDKEVHFIVITDSCHSGSNTKDSSFSVRSVPSNINSRETDTYLGREYFNEIKNDNGEIVRLSPPLGKHVKLSACTNSEVAKEKSLGIDSKVRGIFTYSILEVLKSNGYNLSYLNLASKVRIKALSLTKDQSPQLETIALHPQEHNRIFLNGLLEGEQPTFQVSHNEKENRWEINVGSIYGIHEKDIAVLLDDDEQVEITAVQTTFSILDFGPLNFHPRDKIFDATVIPKSRRKLKIGFSTNSHGSSSNTFLLEFLEKSPVIELGSGNDINYIIRVADDTLALTHPESYIPIFSRIHGQREPQARLFLKIVEQIAEWHHIVYISNPNSKIEESEVEIKFSAIEKTYIAPLNLIDSVSSILIEDWQEDNVFRYHFYEEHPKGPWHTPAFRLSLINNSKKRKLWVSVLYCGTGYTVDGTGMNYSSTSFSITNRFLEKEELSIGGIAKLTDELNGVELESITLSLLDDYFDQGYNEIKDTIKIFLSTEEIDTSPFNMVGVPIDVEEVMAPRPAGTLRPLEVQQSDWRTFEIPVTIVRPRDEGTLNIRQSKSLYGLTIVGHPTFSARIILSTMEEFIRSTKVIVDGHKKYMPRPEILYGNETVFPINFTNGLGDVEGCSVIELYRSEGTEFINEEQPLVFCIDSKISPLTDEHKLILVGYSSDKRAYFSLGIMNENREIKINGLPFESPSVIDGLGNSIKLILLKVKLEFEIPSFLSISKSL